MYRKAIQLLTCAGFLLLFCQCVSTQQQAAVKNPPITVQGIMYYPDGVNQTYIVPAGAEVIGAGGNNCRYIVESGGKLSAHSGTSNSYQIKAGGTFRGFAHPAKNCKVTYQNGAKILKEKSGDRVEFLLAQ